MSICRMSVLNAFWPWDRLALLWPGAMLTDLRFVLVMGWFLQPHGCDEGQGYYFSEAIAAEAFARLLTSGRRC